MPISLIDIPELQNGIACHLGTHDLAAAARVSKAWSAAFTPYLWRSIDVEGPFLDKLYAPIPLTPCQKISRRLRRLTPDVIDLQSTIISRMVTKPRTRTRTSTNVSTSSRTSMTNFDSWRDDSMITDAFRTPSQFFLNTLHRRGKHIRSLSLFRWDDISIVGSYCRHLTSLTMTVSSSEHCWRATLELIRANPSLVKLAITIIRTEFISTSEQFDLFRLLSKLEELDMTDNYGTMDTALFLRLLTTCPQLKTLRLKASVAPDEGVSDDAAKTMPTPPPTPKPSCSSLASLQELELAVNNIRVVDHEYLLPWLKHFPSLRSFKLPDMMTRHVPEACTLFQHHLHYIEKLDLSHLHCLEDEHFAALIEACSSRYRQGGPASLHSPLPLSSPSSLESLSVSRRRMTALRELQLECCSIGFHTVKAIVTHHRDTLEVLNIRRCRESFRSEWIQSLLVSCSALRSFESGQSNGYPKIVTLNAQDMYRSRWACTNLEVLQVSITGICHQRPGPSEAAVDGVSSESSAASTLLASSPECELWSEGGDQSLLCHPHPPLAAARAHGDEGEGVQNDHAICMEIQAEVYEQLGQLRRLRRLDVGRIGKRWASEEQKRLVESSSLEWRLSSGMLGNCNDVNDGPLSRLHQLEELGLAWTEQSLGVAELEWMKRHWPRLCKIIGDEKWIQRQPDVSTWVATHWPGLEILYKSG